MSAIESTYKSQETEETLDKLFYRPLGYRAALVAKRLKMTPNAVTISSIGAGVVAGLCFYYEDPILLSIGIILLILAETLDSADGQLARMTKQFSKIGRILDGAATSVMYLSIYIFLCLRLIGDGYPIWIFLIALVSGMCHSYQTNFADFFRNAYLQFSGGDSKGELKASAVIKDEANSANSGFEKFMLKFYYNYAITQESITKKYRRVFALVESFGENIPTAFHDRYKQLNKPNIKYYNILTANTRMLALIVALIIDKPIYFFAFELSVLNLLAIFTVVKQNRIAEILISEFDNHKGKK
jgi:phosphatidylglycerophosphate synthase